MFGKIVVDFPEHLKNTPEDLEKSGGYFSGYHKAFRLLAQI